MVLSSFLKTPSCPGLEKGWLLDLYYNPFSGLSCSGLGAGAVWFSSDLGGKPLRDSCDLVA